MAEGWGPDAADAVLAAEFNNTAFAESEVWIQLHVGPPGAAGTQNVAVNNTRMDASACFGSPSAGSVVNTAVIGPWAAVPATETYTHWSKWSAASGGSFRMSGVIAGDSSVTAGDPFEGAVGQFTVSLPLAS